MGEEITDDENDPTGLSKIITPSEFGYPPTKNKEPYFHVPFEEHALYNLLPKRQSTDVLDEGTQTTPGDFRAMKFDLPHLEDFKAIHNNEEGHHGLAHSYRKLIVKCGSLWAEERATATKIREELKIFIELPHMPKSPRTPRESQMQTFFYHIASIFGSFL